VFIPFPPRSETTAVPRDDRTLVTLSGRTLSGIPKSSPEFRMDPKSGTTCDCSDSAVVAVLDVVQAAFASFGRWNGPPFAPSIQAFQRQSCCASPSQSWQRDRRGTDSRRGRPSVQPSAGPHRLEPARSALSSGNPLRSARVPWRVSIRMRVVTLLRTHPA